MIEYEGIVTASVAKQIAETIRSAIIDGRIKANERLPTETELAQRYGVSRPTVREALKRLAAQNLVRSHRGPAGGNFVTTPDPTELATTLSGAVTLLASMGAFGYDEVAAARLSLEGECCRLAAVNRSEDDIARMEAELTIQRNESITDIEFCASDVRFHRALVDGTRNGLISFVMFGVIEAMTPVTNMVIFRVRERIRIVQLHEALLQAIRRKDGNGASEILAKLIGYIQEQYRQALKKRTNAKVVSK